MKAMILAAGRGERMRPLTDRTPKPLLEVAGRSLIEHQLDRLRRAGIDEAVINLAYRGEQIRRHLGDGGRHGLRIHYSDEGEQALETAGGIIQALPLLGHEPFVLINSDLWCDYPLHRLSLPTGALAHLLLVDNPGHHGQGDFALSGGRLALRDGPKFTYSGIGLFHPELFRPYTPGRRRLVDVLHPAIADGRVTGEHFAGEWLDVGTPERLQFLRQRLSSEE